MSENVPEFAPRFDALIRKIGVLIPDFPDTIEGVKNLFKAGCVVNPTKKTTVRQNHVSYPIRDVLYAIEHNLTFITRNRYDKYYCKRKGCINPRHTNRNGASIRAVPFSDIQQRYRSTIEKNLLNYIIPLPVGVTATDIWMLRHNIWGHPKLSQRCWKIHPATPPHIPSDEVRSLIANLAFAAKPLKYYRYTELKCGDTECVNPRHLKWLDPTVWSGATPKVSTKSYTEAAKAEVEAEVTALLNPEPDPEADLDQEDYPSEEDADLPSRVVTVLANNMASSKEKILKRVLREIAPEVLEFAKSLKIVDGD